MGRFISAYQSAHRGDSFELSGAETIKNIESVNLTQEKGWRLRCFLLPLLLLLDFHGTAIRWSERIRPEAK